MKSKIIGKVTPKCVYCAGGKLAADGQRVLCVRKGILATDESCRKFRFDPLKKVPEKTPKIGQYSEEDFRLS